MSTHTVDVIRIPELEIHPNADKLEICHIGQYQCVVGKEQFKVGDLAAYVEPDYLVDTARPEFSFLAKEARYGVDGGPKTLSRIKVRKMRGLYSQGLLLPAPEGASEGDNVMEQLGIRRYEPPEPNASTGGKLVKAPADFPKYDVENWYKYSYLLQEGEPVIVTEKIHGANARYVYKDGQMYCGSRQYWKAEDETDLWWKALRQNPWAGDYCKAHPDWVLFGEVFGNVQSLKYGRLLGSYGVVVFDVFTGSAGFTNGYMPVNYARPFLAEHWAPVVYEGPYNADAIKALADGPSLIPGAKHHREGIVVRPLKERQDSKIGRVQLKIVSNTFLSKEE